MFELFNNHSASQSCCWRVSLEQAQGGRSSVAGPEGPGQLSHEGQCGEQDRACLSTAREVFQDHDNWTVFLRHEHQFYTQGTIKSLTFVLA